MKTFVAAGVVFLSAAACTSPWEEAWGPNFPQSRPGEAAIYLVRDAAPTDAAPINLGIGRRPIGSLAGRSWMRFDLQPRLYDLHAYGTLAGTEQIITVAPGETRFLQVEATPSGGAQILEISPRDGRRMVGQGERAMAMQVPPYE